MARYTGPKNRLSRREGVDLGMKTVGSHAQAQLLRRLNIIPGQHGVRGKRKVSDYGVQLREKQKVKRMYGMMERQFRKIFQKAKKYKGNTGEQLIQFLESRLDNTLYRMALAPTRACARQQISHRHVFVDGKVVTIPSFEVQKDQVISYTPKGIEVPSVKKMIDEKNVQMPAWVERKGPVGKVLRLPNRTDVTDDMNEQLIIEFYSR
jgi:small subunit ribosomal protein S4